MKIFDKVLNNIQGKENEKKRLKIMRKEKEFEFATLIFDWCEHGMPVEEMKELNVTDEFQYLMHGLEMNRHLINDDQYEILARCVNIRLLNREREEMERLTAAYSHGQKVMKSPSINEEYETSV